MFGDSFFTITKLDSLETSNGLFSSPCLGILFSQAVGCHHDLTFKKGFRPHVWGFFFHQIATSSMKRATCGQFSSPCLGILFSRRKSRHLTRKLIAVFVPMFGDSFFTGNRRHAETIGRHHVFVPMFGDSFFTAGLGCPTGWALYGPFAAGISN